MLQTLMNAVAGTAVMRTRTATTLPAPTVVSADWGTREMASPAGVSSVALK